MKQMMDRFLERPPVEWDAMIDEHGRREFQQAVDDLDALIQKAARAREYINQRCGHGCGDQGHAIAVKKSNNLVTKIRKALGFTYPKREIEF